MTTQDIDLRPPEQDQRRAMRFEDAAEKFVLLVAFLWIFAKSARTIGALIAMPGHDLMWALRLVSTVGSLVFVGLVVCLTLTRKPPVGMAPGLEARLSAFLGTFVLMSLTVIPRAAIGEVQALAATVLILVGTVSSIWCLWWLGRAFAVMAAARELRVTGPYAHVRHPLYTAEAIMVVGAVMMNGSLLALFVGALQFFFQYRRILHEEAVLERSFDDYAAYRARTPMILPRLF